ncbi:MAG: nucleotidyltransferase family protein [Terracidiphilus sp.]|jgi:NDP-sugar pyrophosphorylase family protein
MKAMILAAGLGTRLRPLTDDRPKALVTLAGRTLLEIALARLRSFGVSEVIVNAHHHAEMIADYIKAHDFGMRIELSLEENLLDTGGGLKKAAHFFSDNGGEPFILHNVDVISAIDLGQMVSFHTRQAALATLAVQQRESSRQLLFDEVGRLCGRRIVRAAKAESPEIEWARPAAQVQPLAFAGIHVLSPLIFQKMEEQGAFSIIDAYLHLASRGEKIIAFRADEYYWRDLGRPENLLHVAQDIANGKYAIT